jgi:hypothetical protein
MIIIIGDSWGVGEYDKTGNLNGPGFGQYLMLHNDVVNLSKGAGSNSMSLHHLKNFISRFTVNENDRIFWIVTCPTRCVNLQYFIESERSILELSHDLLETSLDQAQRLCEHYNVTIDLIGGLCDLPALDTTTRPGLKIQIPSWGRFIDSNYVTSMIDPDWWISFGEILKTQKSQRLSEWVSISQTLISKHHSMSAIFKTDGYHPDRSAHRALRDYFYPDHAHML